MIPIKDHNPSGKFPFFTYFLLSLNIIVFIYIFLMPEEMLSVFLQKYALIPVLIIQGKNWHAFFTSLFLHGSFGHIIGNMLFLNIFGDNLEDKLGKLRYLIFYFLCGILASLSQIIIYPSSQIPNIGASGAIAGLMGGYLVLFPHHKIDILYSFGFGLRKTTVPAFFILFYWLLAQIFSGLGSLSYAAYDSGGVAFFAHIGGFLAGYFLVKILKKKPN